jgi:hypothetical protein
MSSHLRAIGRRMVVSLAPDAEGFVGRECPSAGCLGYFKIAPGTGNPTVASCTCPYCGTCATHDQFFTPEQNEYTKSVVLNRFTGALLKDLKALERRPRRGAFFSIGLSVTGRPHPIRHYREKALETILVCQDCSLRYAIYGVFGHCPDCRSHNSCQILDANLDLVGRMLDLAADAPDVDLTTRLVENALEDCVSTFDAWGRATVAAFASCAAAPTETHAVSFQNLDRVRRRLHRLFGFEVASAIDENALKDLRRTFQKRHLFAHKMGVVDQEYVETADDSRAVVGRKITVTAAEVRSTCEHLRVFARQLLKHLRALTTSAEGLTDIDG